MTTIKYNEIRKNKRLTDYEDVRDYIVCNHARAIKTKRRADKYIQTGIFEY